MQRTFEYNDILKQVLEFLAKLGIEPYDESELILDGELHRFRLRDDKPSEKSGAIKIHIDGWPAGFVQDWRKGTKENWKYDISGLDDEQRKYFNSEEYRKKSEEQQRRARKKREAEHLRAADAANRFWERLEFAPEQHPYSVRKHIPCFTEECLRYNPKTKCLAVPLTNIAGRVCSIQWIAEEGHKTFCARTSIDGLFWSVWLLNLDKAYTGVILLGEGFATMAKVFELTKKPCVAAMSCYSLEEIARILREAFPEAKIIITADNDWETERKHDRNPGLLYANVVANSSILGVKLADGVVSPEFTDADVGLSDWDDYAIKYGDEATAKILQEKIDVACMTDAERKEYKAVKELEAIAKELDKSIQIPPEDFIAGIFPRKRISAVIAPPGTGKTWFLQRTVSDLSIGGTIFDGFAEEAEPLKSVVFAGEAGPEMMIRRAAAVNWPVNQHNVKIYGMVDAEKKGLSVMLDEPEGKKNIERIIKLHKPDIVFFDTLGSFHNSDENKADAMKPILRWLLTTAEIYNIAVILMHHSRKMLNGERSRELTQDDAIGSYIFNRLVSMIVSIQPDAEDSSLLVVKSVKSWFAKFMPFTYKLTEDTDGHTAMKIDIAPSVVKDIRDTKFELLMLLRDFFEPGQWFKASDIPMHRMDKKITPRQLRRLLAVFVDNKHLRKRGELKGTEYSVIGLNDN